MLDLGYRLSYADSQKKTSTHKGVAYVGKNKSRGGSSVRWSTALKMRVSAVRFRPFPPFQIRRSLTYAFFHDILRRMVDTRKTQVISLTQVRECATTAELRCIVAKIQQEVRGGMTLPCDPRDRLVALNTMHNVFDRIDEALDRLEEKGKNHE